MILEFIFALTDAQFWSLLFVLGVIVAYLFSSLVTKLTGWR